MVTHTSLDDVFEGLRCRLVQKLEGWGFEVPEGAKTKVFDAMLAYLRVQHRAIAARPRRVACSKELKMRVLSADIRLALDNITLEIIAGRNLTPRLTRCFFKAGFDDRLFNDLGVQHLHLGFSREAKDRTGQHQMVEGGDELLWVVVTDEVVHFIDVIGHQGFSEYDFGRVIYDNWPELLGPPLAGTEPDSFTPQERARLRRSGLNTMLDIDGKAYVRGWFSTSGTSVEVVNHANFVLNRIVSLYREVERDPDHYAGILAAKAGGRAPQHLELSVNDKFDLVVSDEKPAQEIV